MHLLRERLSQQDPDLYASLIRSWNIAFEQWIPALATSSSSFNSYPHLRNLEHYLDEVFVGFEAYPPSRTKLELRPVELYLILAAILFHDIGRMQDHPLGHGASTREILRRRWAQLGIPSAELAYSLAEICLYHEPPKNSPERSKLDSGLRTTIIDPYGEIRQLALASLLTLVDYIDGAYCRVTPGYLKTFAELDPIGAFRRGVSGVYLDAQNRMIRTVLGSNLEPTREEMEELRRMDEEAVKVELGENPTERDIQEKRTEIKGKRGLFSDEARLEFKTNPDRVSESNERTIEDCENDEALLQKLCPNNDKNWHTFPLRARVLAAYSNLVPPFAPKVYLVARGLYQVRKGKRNDESEKLMNGYWPAEYVLATIMGNVRENAEALDEVKDNLAAFGIPILAWVIEHDERLYNVYGQETCEPVFDEDYLLRVAKGMYELSRRTFGVGSFTYETLAAQIRDPNVSAVVRAVRRIAIVSRDCRKHKCGNGECPDDEGAIRFETDSWRWEVSLDSDARCSYVRLEDIEAAIRRLGRPAGE